MSTFIERRRALLVADIDARVARWTVRLLAAEEQSRFARADSAQDAINRLGVLRARISHASDADVLSYAVPRSQED